MYQKGGQISAIRRRPYPWLLLGSATFAVRGSCNYLCWHHQFCLTFTNSMLKRLHSDPYIVLFCAGGLRRRLLDGGEEAIDIDEEEEIVDRGDEWAEGAKGAAATDDVKKGSHIHPIARWVAGWSSGSKNSIPFMLYDTGTYPVHMAHRAHIMCMN
jgi:hypothetical protein